MHDADRALLSDHALRVNADSSEIVFDRAFFDALPTIVFVFDDGGNVVFVNRALVEYAGGASEAFLGGRWLESVPSTEVQRTRARFARGAARGKPFSIKLRIRSAAGSFRTFEARMTPQARGRGASHYWIGVATDRESERDSEERLADTELRFQSVLDSIPLIVWTADASGWIDWYNAHWYRFTGQTPEEAAGWGWQAAHHPEDFPKVMERWPESIRTGKPFEMEFRLRRADGDFRWMLTRIVPLCDASGTVLRWFGSNTDIEEQKRIEQRSRRVATLLHEALLPAELPRVPGLRIDGLYLPAESDALVGGDWYDAIVLGDGRVLVSCGDVTGHGLQAAADAFRLRQAIAFAGREDPDPATVLRRLNSVMVGEGGALATAVVALFSVDRTSVAIALAGHPPPIIANPDGDARAIAPDGFPLGLASDLSVTTRSYPLAPDAVVLFYTDGLTEFSRDVIAAERNLEDAAAVLAAGTSHASSAHFVRDTALAGHRPYDDVAILVLQCGDRAAPAATNVIVTFKTWRFHSSHPQSAHNARIELGRYLAAFDADDGDVANAELVIGEILANTVEHAPGLVEITIDWRQARPRLTIVDSGRGVVPREPCLPEALSEDGRGLYLIYALADDVSITAVPTVGTTVACTLRMRRAVGEEPGQHR